nr:hypothetical protein [Acinetobacter sp. UBA3106]
MAPSNRKPVSPGQPALFQAGVSLMNRRDPRIIESEAKWGIRDPKQIQVSDYYVTGSINSLDLSLSDTRSSKVVANVSLQQQIAAQDYGLSAGGFAGHTLLNIQTGKGEREATNKDNKDKDDKEQEKSSMLWDANPEVVENYWSSTQRD